jgi:type IV secretion system protein VirB6
MADICPAIGPNDPLVQGLLTTVDCHVQGLVQTGYGALVQDTGGFATALTALLTLYVAFIGYRLMLGRATLNVGDMALTAVKLGAVLALCTQWGAYQALVYHTLFYGPQQAADLILHASAAKGSGYGGDVFDGLQRAFTDLTAFSPAQPPGPGAATAATGPSTLAAGQGALSTLLSKAGFDALLLLLSAVVLLLSSLGVLLAAKVVLAMLLAVGPIFIAALLFDTTRGLFEGWLRAALGFALAPVLITLLLGVGLALLEPSLHEIDLMRENNAYTPGVGFGVAVLTTVFALVATGLVVAVGVIAAGFKLPQPWRPSLAGASTEPTASAPFILPPRTERLATALAAQTRRDAATPAERGWASASPASDRRTIFTLAAQGAGDVLPVLETRLGQSTRRTIAPKAARSGERSPS